MRVIAGKARRLPLKTLPGSDTRPTTDRIKETLFNILQQEIPDCSFLDLFSGSGAIGIEALSRGAASAVFVEKNPKDVEELLNQEAIFEAGKTVNEALIGKIATIGENLSIRRFARFESKGLIEKYIHGDGKIAVLVNMTKGDKELAKDLCMQIAAARPEFVTREEVPQERVDKEMEILKVQAMNEGKPEQIAEKIVQGRVGKFYEEICLVDQVFVKDSSMKVSELLKQKDAEIVEFARFEKGEGIEKKEENFAEEVMSFVK